MAACASGFDEERLGLEEEIRGDGLQGGRAQQCGISSHISWAQALVMMDL